MNSTIKIKKGGVDSIVAFIVVLLPLVYILIFMVATLYHFAVQMYMNQVVKETLVMASTYGTVTGAMDTELKRKISNITGDVDVVYYIRKFDNGNGVVGNMTPIDPVSFPISQLEKADLLGIYVESREPSLLATVSNFNILGTNIEGDDNSLKYTSYREEIIRNDPPS